MERRPSFQIFRRGELLYDGVTIDARRRHIIVWVWPGAVYIVDNGWPNYYTHEQEGFSPVGPISWGTNGNGYVKSGSLRVSNVKLRRLDRGAPAGNDAEQLMAYWTEVLSDRSDDLTSLLIRGRIFNIMKRHDAAAADFRRAIELLDDDDWATSQLAVAEHEAGRPVEAARMVDAYLQAHPDAVCCNYFAARIKVLADDPQLYAPAEALRRLKHVQQVHPEYRLSWENFYTTAVVHSHNKIFNQATKTAVARTVRFAAPDQKEAALALKAAVDAKQPYRLKKEGEPTSPVKKPAKKPAQKKKP